MTLPYTAEAWARALAQADANIAANAWVHVGAPDWPVEEAAYAEARHPRDRRGRWRFAGGRHRGSRYARLSYDEVSRFVEDAKVMRDAGTPIRFDADVASIGSTREAEEAFGKMGVEAHLDGIGDAEALRQLVQATRDMVKRFPTLKEGPWSKLEGIATYTSVKHPGSEIEGLVHGQDAVWAVTGPNPNRGNMEPGEFDAPDGTPALKAFGGKGGSGNGTWILLNDTYHFEAEEGFGTEAMGVAGRSLSWADKRPYGRLTHELGHAVAYTAGLFSRTAQYRGREVPFDAALIMKHVSIPQMRIVSAYASAAATEAWAEMFATLNTPGVLDGYSEGIRTALLALRADANKQAGVRVL